jgi:hypothetical protein
MLAHGVGEIRARLHVLPHLDQHALEDLVVLLRAEDLQALHQGQTGVDHDGELPREDGDGLGRDAATPLRQRDLLPLFFDRGDDDLLPPHRIDDGVFRVGDQHTSLGLSVPRCALPLECRHVVPPPGS